MKIIEQFVEGKESDPEACEDLIVVTDGFVAVIDGATDKSGVDFGGESGGRLAAGAVRDALLKLDGGAVIEDLVDASSGLLADRVASVGTEIDLQTDDGPSASFVVFSEGRQEIWRVGDCSWMSEVEAFPGSKEIDSICANARSTLLRALLEQGVPAPELLASDPGREMILPLLRNQSAFRNLEDVTSSLAFGAIDGHEVPRRFQEVWPVGDSAELVLASDGYPILGPTLEVTEKLLAEDLARDPLRIGAHPSTKGVAPGLTSFDDRSYLRIAVRD